MGEAKVAVAIGAALAALTVAGSSQVGSASPDARSAPVPTVTASSHDGNVPGNVVDGKLDTRWSARGDGQWIQFDLGARQPVHSVSIAWFKGDQRRASFEVQASIDGRQWTTVRNEVQSSGSTLEAECHIVWRTEPRYLRIVGHGNDHSSNEGRLWNSITEVDLFSSPDCDGQAGTPGPEPTPAPTPTGQPTPPPPPEQPPGQPGAKPNADNTGPRYPIERTISASDAMAELRKTGKLSRVQINGMLQLSGSDGKNWVVTDSIIVPGSNRYGVQAYHMLDAFTGSKAERMRFEHVEIRGTAVTGQPGLNNGLIMGKSVIVRNSEIHGAEDLIKIFGDMVVESNYLHGLDHPPGAHSDVIHVQSGTGIEVRNNTMIADIMRGGAKWPGGNAVLQTGTVNGPIQGVWENNWVNGGNYTLRGYKETSHSVQWRFSGNKHGRNFRYGPHAEMRPGFSDGTNMWEDTGQKFW